jgi:hypothetical protein
MNTFNYCIDHEKVRDALDAHEDMRLDLEDTVDVTDPHLIERLNHPDADVRRSALQTLSVLEPSALASCADAVAAGLDDAEESVRLVAAQVLGMLAPPALAAHTGALVARLRDPYWDVRAAAVTGLGSLELVALGEADGPVAKRIVLSLVDPTPAVRTARAELAIL